MMEMVDIDEAKTHLDRLVERAARGEAFIIAKAGRPLVKVVPLDATAQRQPRRLGFLNRRLSIPGDFDTMGDEAVVAAFHGDR
jgi:prevent-host-death family protein